MASQTKQNIKQEFLPTLNFINIILRIHGKGLNMLKKILILLSTVIHFNLYAMPWKQYNFQKISPEVENCLSLSTPDENGKFIKLPIIYHLCEHNKDGPWNRSFYVVNKDSEYFVLDKPINLLKLKEATGEDYSQFSNGYFNTKMILQNGDRYAQLCFFSSPSGHDMCEVNMYLDLLDGRVTAPELGGDMFLESKLGYVGYWNCDYSKNTCHIILRKMFSKLDKKIEIPINGFIVSDGEFLPDNKIQITESLNFNKKNEKKFKKIIPFDPKQIEDE